MKKLKKLIKNIRFFKVLKELKYYKKYVKAVNKLENSESWNNFNVTKSKFNVFGLIVRVPKQDILVLTSKGYDAGTASKIAVNSHISDLIEDMKNCGLVSALVYGDLRYMKTESEDNFDYNFYEVLYSFYWQFFTFGYIVSRFIVLTIVFIIFLLL
jgi:hypothetical protein